MRAGHVLVETDGVERRHSLGTPDAFAAISRAWLRCGWDTRYVYSFTWLGRPIIQLPEDIVRLQELVAAAEPDVIVEAGIGHGGSLVLYASLCKAIGRGRVVGIDLEIRPQNRAAIESHPLASLISLVEGSSTDAATIDQVKSLIRPGERVLLVLDSNHTRDHVLGELEAYADLVGRGSYIVVMDGIMQEFTGAPRTDPDWEWNNPLSAIEQFIADHPEFEVVEPELPFNEGVVSQRVTYFAGGVLQRLT
jgi:cephalosporin hydroxylase